MLYYNHAHTCSHIAIVSFIYNNYVKDFKLTVKCSYYTCIESWIQKYLEASQLLKSNKLATLNTKSIQYSRNDYIHVIYTDVA